MAGQLSDAQPMWVRFPQLRSCFSGAMEAQLFRNQQAVGSNPTGSSHQLADISDWEALICRYRVIG